MSAFAIFTLIPVSAIDQLKDAAMPRKSFFGGIKDNYRDFKKKFGVEVVQYPWSGYVFPVILTYLQERGIDLSHSSQDELADSLSVQTGISTIALTDDHRTLYLSKLEPSNFSEDALRTYYNAFQDVDESDSGKGMLEGIRALHTALNAVNANSLVLLEIG